MKTAEQKEKNRIYMREQRLKNPELFRKRGRAAYRKFVSNKEKKRKLWDKQNNRSKTPEYREMRRISENKRRKIRYATDPHYAIVQLLRSRMTSALKGTGRWEKISGVVGCSRHEFVTHLESKFKDGMSWNNRSQWHVDHIIPCAAFNLLEPDQQKKCFHYTNFQPLWPTENMAKSHGGFWRPKLIDNE